MRDLENPHIWTETYHTPTWVDYVRHNHRRTKADAMNFDQIRALHRGDGPPKVHRMIERQVIPPSDDVFHKSHIVPHRTERHGMTVTLPPLVGRGSFSPLALRLCKDPLWLPPSPP